MFTVLKKYFPPFVCHNADLRLLDIFRPLYYIVSTYGLFPYSIQFLYGIKHLTVTFKSATKTLACNLLVPTVISIFFALHILELSVSSGDNAFTEDQMTRTDYTIEMIFHLLVCITIYICAFKNRSSYIKILNLMAGCWTELPNSSANMILGRLRAKVYCVVLVSVLIIPILHCLIICTGSVTIWKKLLVFLTFVLPELIQLILVTFFFIMILMIVALLKNIEEHIKILYCVKTLWNVKNEVESGSLHLSLWKLRRAYARALSVKRQVNAAFQAPLLLVLAQSFHSLISEAHTLYHGLTFQNDFSTHNVVENCFWVLQEIIKIHILGHAGAMIKLQAVEIGRTLHNIPANRSEDVILYLEIQHFTTLMTFQDTQIVVFGYFSLESSLIFNVIASATMYLVILVQFDKP